MPITAAPSDWQTASPTTARTGIIKPMISMFCGSIMEIAEIMAIRLLMFRSIIYSMMLMVTLLRVQ